eukprot:GEMP01033037.1.p1 GENE.GEMP01033037.1~~GEMP01033037.1.p1  ORF type:complete len:360 (+),score=57.56 GEMP01033037.1:489-1568(+)
MFEAFNLYKKVNEDYLDRNYSGFVMSIVGVLCIVSLVTSQIYYAFVQTNWTNEMRSIQITESNMTVILEVTFPEMPCKYIEIMGLQGRGMFIKPMDTKDMNFAARDNGCLAHGMLTIPRVGGSFWFTPHYPNILALDDTATIKANMSHVVNYLAFGGEYFATVYRHIPSSHSVELEYSALVTRELFKMLSPAPMESWDFVFPAFIDQEPNNAKTLKEQFHALHDASQKDGGAKYSHFIYDLHLVPVKIDRSHRDGADEILYEFTYNSHIHQYSAADMKSSLGYHFHKASLDEVPLHATIFHFQMSPISIYRKKDQTAVVPFMIELLGAVGGIYVVFLIFDWAVGVGKDLLMGRKRALTI